MLLFDFTVTGAPVSSQAHRGSRREAYRQKVSAAARGRWHVAQRPIATAVAVTITHLFEGAPPDLDNIAKLILDGMVGVVLIDDRQISDLVLQRRPVTGPFVVGTFTAALTAALGLGAEFVHIAVATPPAQGELRAYEYP